MPQQKGIKKIAAVFFYLVVIYHLLPFSPIALYYTSHHPSVGAKSEMINAVAAKPVIKLGISFPVKDKNRFDVDCSFFITPLRNEFIVSYKTISFPVFDVNYSNSHFSHCSGRGPPSFLS